MTLLKARGEGSASAKPRSRAALLDGTDRGELGPRRNYAEKEVALSPLGSPFEGQALQQFLSGWHHSLEAAAFKASFHPQRHAWFGIFSPCCTTAQTCTLDDQPHRWAVTEGTTSRDAPQAEDKTTAESFESPKPTTEDYLSKRTQSTLHQVPLSDMMYNLCRQMAPHVADPQAHRLQRL